MDNVIRFPVERRAKAMMAERGIDLLVASIPPRTRMTPIGPTCIEVLVAAGTTVEITDASMPVVVRHLDP